MTEEQATAVNNQESGAPEANTQKENVQQPQANAEATLGSKEYNFRQMEKRLREQEQRIWELTEAQKSKALPAESEDESLPQLSPDDIPEWKHIQTSLKTIEKRAEKIADEKIKKWHAEQEKTALPNRVKAKHPDFDKVVTAERVQQLEQENPELAQAFSVAADPYSATYAYLKALHASKPQNPIAAEEAAKIAQNANKPQSSNAAGRQGALKNAAAFAHKPKDQLYKEMMECASRAI